MYLLFSLTPTCQDRVIFEGWTDGQKIISKYSVINEYAPGTEPSPHYIAKEKQQWHY